MPHQYKLMLTGLATVIYSEHKTKEDLGLKTASVMATCFKKETEIGGEYKIVTATALVMAHNNKAVSGKESMNVL